MAESKSSSSELINANGKLPATSSLDRMLYDITIECSSEDASDSDLEGLRMSVLSEVAPDPHLLERTSPTTWKYPGIIELYHNMGRLVIVTQSEEAGDFGFLDLTEEISLHLRNTAVQAGVHKHKINTEDGNPPLWVKFALAAAERDQRQQHPSTLLSLCDELATTSRQSEEASMGPDFLAAGMTWYQRYQKTGSVADLSNTIENLELAVSFTPKDHQLMPAYLNDLGNLFVLRFNHTDDLEDIAAGIAHQQKAVELTPEGSPEMPVRVQNLGNSFSRRFARTEDLGDLSAAIKHQQMAVELTPTTGRPEPLRLGLLGDLLSRRFERTRDSGDISAAIEHSQKALRLAPEGNPGMLMQLSNLATSFAQRFEQTGDPSDNSAAIEHAQKALKLTPEGHPDFPKQLNVIGISFARRFEQTGDPADNSAAIEHIQKVLELTPEGCR